LNPNKKFSWINPAFSGGCGAGVELFEQQFILYLMKVYLMRAYFMNAYFMIDGLK